MFAKFWFGCVASVVLASGSPVSTAFGESPFESGRFRWTVSEPMLEVDQSQFPPSPGHPWIAVKDPSVVQVDGVWHLFCSVRRRREGDGRIHIGYMSFRDWPAAQHAKWSILTLTMGYHGAPQIFYFEPHRKWYLVYQAEDSTRNLAYGPCYSTNDDISDPEGWTLPEPLYVPQPGVKVGLDFWVICDAEKAHLFHTTNNGKMWRAETLLDNFPSRGWTRPTLALSGDIFEASHTYKLQGRDEYFTIIEAQDGRRGRYFKGFVAKTLDGVWRPVAASKDRPLVSPQNVANQDRSWATSYSHGEFVRAGVNERLEIDPADLQIVFQGVDTAEYQVKGYGNIPWKLGILTAVE